MNSKYPIGTLLYAPCLDSDTMDCIQSVGVIISFGKINNKTWYEIKWCDRDNTVMVEEAFYIQNWVDKYKDEM